MARHVARRVHPQQWSFKPWEKNSFRRPQAICARRVHMNGPPDEHQGPSCGFVTICLRVRGGCGDGSYSCVAHGKTVKRATTLGIFTESLDCV